MKNTLQNLGASGLSFLLMLSTLTVHLDMHFCGDHLVDMAMGRKAATCGVEIDTGIVPGTCSMAAMNCCSDLEISLQGQKDLQKAHVVAHLAPIYAPGIIAPAQLALPSFKLSADGRLGFNAHSPPPLLKNARLFFGVFLI